MTTTERTITIERRNLEAKTWLEFVEKAIAFAGWTKDTPVYSYRESVLNCSLLQLPVGQIGEVPADDVPFEGRIFNKHAEWRWMPSDEGGYSGWLLRDPPAEGTGNFSVRCRPEPQRYYLLGEARRDGAVAANGTYPFEDGRYPGKVFEYPLPADIQVKQTDRAYIQVVEYELPEPQEWSPHVDEVESALNLPLLVAHRFVGVSKGRD